MCVRAFLCVACTWRVSAYDKAGTCRHTHTHLYICCVHITLQVWMTPQHARATTCPHALYNIHAWVLIYNIHVCVWPGSPATTTTEAHTAINHSSVNIFMREEETGDPAYTQHRYISTHKYIHIYTHTYIWINECSASRILCWQWSAMAHGFYGSYPDKEHYSIPWSIVSEEVTLTDWCQL